MQEQMVFAMRLFIVAAWLCQGAVSQKRWREVLLEQAHKRIEDWYTNPQLVEAPRTRQGIAVRMMKNDMMCGGDTVPVTFAEFDVEGARPVDVFNTMLETNKQKDWNNQVRSAVPIGDWPDEGARAWAVTFNIPLVNAREFIQWQVADADFANEDFWLAFSTQNNGDLERRHPVDGGTVESQNCLGAYHITKTLTGSHVIITQQVNVHPFFNLPLHQILDFFPVAWQGTINFVHEMSANARKLAALGAPLNNASAPAFMLAEPPQMQHNTSLVEQPQFVSRAEAFAEPTAVTEAKASWLHIAFLVLAVPSCILCFASAGFGAGRWAARGLEAYRGDSGSGEEDLEDSGFLSSSSGSSPRSISHNDE